MLRYPGSSTPPLPPFSAALPLSRASPSPSSPRPSSEPSRSSSSDENPSPLFLLEPCARPGDTQFHAHVQVRQIRRAHQIQALEGPTHWNSLECCLPRARMARLGNPQHETRPARGRTATRCEWKRKGRVAEPPPTRSGGGCPCVITGRECVPILKAWCA